MLYHVFESLEKCLYAGKEVFLWVRYQYHQLLPFLIDVKLDRTSALLSKRSVVLVISPLVPLHVTI